MDTGTRQEGLLELPMRLFPLCHKLYVKTEMSSQWSLIPLALQHRHLHNTIETLQKQFKPQLWLQSSTPQSSDCNPARQKPPKMSSVVLLQSGNLQRWPENKLREAYVKIWLFATFKCMVIRIIQIMISKMHTQQMFRPDQIFKNSNLAGRGGGTHL